MHMPFEMHISSEGVCCQIFSKGAQSSVLETTPLKGVTFRILQHNFNSLFGIPLNSNPVPGCNITL